MKVSFRGEEAPHSDSAWFLYLCNCVLVCSPDAILRDLKGLWPGWSGQGAARSKGGGESWIETPLFFFDFCLGAQLANEVQWLGTKVGLPCRKWPQWAQAVFSSKSFRRELSSPKVTKALSWSLMEQFPPLYFFWIGSYIHFGMGWWGFFLNSLLLACYAAPNCCSFCFVLFCLGQILM